MIIQNNFYFPREVRIADLTREVRFILTEEEFYFLYDQLFNDVPGKIFYGQYTQWYVASDTISKIEHYLYNKRLDKSIDKVLE